MKRYGHRTSRSRERQRKQTPDSMGTHGRRCLAVVDEATPASDTGESRSCHTGTAQRPLNIAIWGGQSDLAHRIPLRIVRTDHWLPDNCERPFRSRQGKQMNMEQESRTTRRRSSTTIRSSGALGDLTRRRFLRGAGVVAAGFASAASAAEAAEISERRRSSPARRRRPHGASTCWSAAVVPPAWRLLSWPPVKGRKCCWWNAMADWAVWRSTGWSDR